MAAEHEIKDGVRFRRRAVNRLALVWLGRPPAPIRRDIETALETIEQNIAAMRRDQEDINRLKAETRMLLKQLGVA